MEFRLRADRRILLAAGGGLAVVLAVGATVLALATGDDRNAITHGRCDRPWVALTFDADNRRRGFRLVTLRRLLGR